MKLSSPARLSRPKFTHLASLAVAVALASGCGDPSFGTTAETGEGTGGSGGGHEKVAELLVLTTTDFATGAVASLNLETGDFAEHALGSSDGRVQVIGERVFVLHRFMFDYLDIFDPSQGWARVAQIPLDLDGVVSTNPQAIAQGEDGLLYIALFGSSSLLVVDEHTSAANAIVDTIDLSEFADADGVAETANLIAHDNTLALFVQRVNREMSGWPQVEENLVVFIDPSTRSIIDLDPEAAGNQGLVLPGQGLHQVRVDPHEPGVAYVLSSGLVRVDLDTRQAQWALPPQSFEAQGIELTTQPQAFDIDDQGNAFLAAYDQSFDDVSIYRAPLDDSAPLTPIVQGLFSVDRSLEIVGDTLWFSDTTLGAEGLRAFDLEGAPLGPRIDTGLPPYSLAAR